jgi:hypothetical protein
MRVYIIGSIVIWCVVFLGWYSFAVYTHPYGPDDGLSSGVDDETLSASQCSVEVEALFLMADKFLQAGGPEVPTNLRRNIEACMSSDPVTRDKIAATQLIRLFP